MYRGRSWIAIPVVLISGCATPGPERLDPAIRTVYVDRLKPVMVPCEERVKGFYDTLLDPNTAIEPSLEGKVEALTRSDSGLREYISRLEASALRCGVKIDN